METFNKKILRAHNHFVVLSHMHTKNKEGGRKLLEVIDIGGIDCGDGFTSIALSPRTHQVCMLNKYSFLYLNNTSVKWFKKHVIRSVFLI